MNKKKKQHKINQEIIASQVRVTDGGIMSLSDAIKLAQSKEMDLVLLNGNATPPVCKIMNYEKYIYELSKKPQNKAPELKEIKIGPNTSENDLGYRKKQIIEFLEKGHQVKLTLQFKGREMAFVDKGRESLLNLVLSLSEHGTPDALPDLEGKRLFCTLRPKTKK